MGFLKNGGGGVHLIEGRKLHKIRTLPIHFLISTVKNTVIFLLLFRFQEKSFQGGREAA
jgi:hypothetical protein